MEEIIYGAKVLLPDMPPIETIEGYDLPKSEQYWKRKELPAFFEKVEYDNGGGLLLTKEQEAYATEEVKRCKQGYWFMNNGKPTYVSQKHYFYLQWWKLEDDNRPDYRDTDRRYFLFLNHWENIKSCIGCIRAKKRREGASSQATANLIYECIFFKNSVCGLVSKSQTDGRNTFRNMVSFGYRQLPVFLKPNQLNNKDSVTELVFAHKSSSAKGGAAKTIDNDTGHRSSVDYRSPGINAYDSGRLSRGVFDEGGKWEREHPFSKFIAIVSKTMVKGAKRVGFMECPSTVNEMTKAGGDEYKKVWDAADQFKFERTPNRLVRYFSPAYDGYLGFIDKYGMSVIDEPTTEQYNYLVENFVGIGDLTEEDIKLGAKKYLLSKRANLTGTDLEEEIRMNPFDEREVFLYAGFNCEFNSIRLQTQLESLELNPVYLRRIRLLDDITIEKAIFPGQKDKKRRKIKWMDDQNGDWLLYEDPLKPNAFTVHNDIYTVNNASSYTVGSDTIRIFDAQKGSMATICVFKTSCVLNGKETGCMPVAFYVGRPRLPSHLYDEIIKVSLWYGCRANIERSAGDHFSEYFYKNGVDDLLLWTPARDPNKDQKIHVGTESASPFQLAAQLECAKIFFDGDDPINYNGHTHRVPFPSLLKQALAYDHSDRTKSDEIVALQMALLPALKAAPRGAPANFKPKTLLPTYKISV